MGRTRPMRREPIALAILLAGIIATFGIVSWGSWGARRSADLVPVLGYAIFLAWFGTGLALAIGHPVFRMFRASTLLPPVCLAGFLLAWLIFPDGVYRAWTLVGGLLLLVLGICAVIGVVTASIGWVNGFRRDRIRHADDRGDEVRPH